MTNYQKRKEKNDEYRSKIMRFTFQLSLGDSEVREWFEQQPEKGAYQDAFYDPKAQRITVSTRLSDSKTFAALAREIVHAGIHDRGRYPYYSREDCAMDAECVSYMLCRNFSIDVPQPNVSRVGQAFDGMEAQDRRSVVDSLQKYFRRLQKDIQREISPQERKQPEQNRTVR